MKHEIMPPSNPTEGEKLPAELGEKINENYRLLKKGALNYIVNNDSKIVSQGYHEVKVFRHDNVVALIGTLGATQRILKIPQNTDDFFEESPAGFFEIHFDNELGLIVVSVGAAQYILDMQTGQKISKGYHEISKRDGKLYGRSGNTEEEIELLTSNQVDDNSPR